jgi:hypothetical protein
MTSVVQSSYSISISRSGITMAKSTVLVGFDVFTASCDVDFRVILLVVGLKVGLLVDSVSESAFESVFNLGIGEIVGVDILLFVVVSSISLKMIFRLVRTILLTRFYSLKIVVVSYPTSHSFSDRNAILSSCLAYGLNAYTAHPKVLICL